MAAGPAFGGFHLGLEYEPRVLFEDDSSMPLAFNTIDKDGKEVYTFQTDKFPDCFFIFFPEKLSKIEGVVIKAIRASIDQSIGTPEDSFRLYGITIGSLKRDVVVIRLECKSLVEHLVQNIYHRVLVNSSSLNITHAPSETRAQVKMKNVPSAYRLQVDPEKGELCEEQIEYLAISLGGFQLMDSTEEFD